MTECYQVVSRTATPAELFITERLWNRVGELGQTYRRNQPIPHLHLPEFLEAADAAVIAGDFPSPEAPFWTRYKHYNENKVGLTKIHLFPPRLRQLTEKLNSSDFLKWLSELTGIQGLVADPHVEGGGLHLSGRGGFLNLHADFSTHYYHQSCRRRVNLILYLNPGWNPEWGGAIEFWDRETRTRCAKYTPLLNHAVIFNTDNNALHGFPDPLQCPDNVWRKSVAFYYYTIEGHLRPEPHATSYQARPGDGLSKRALIWLDNAAVNLYSRSKARFGFSDNFASNVLGVLSRKK